MENHQGSESLGNHGHYTRSRNSDFSMKKKKYLEKYLKLVNSTKDDCFDLETNKEVDKYCWECHQSETNKYCFSCVRSFHNDCITLKSLLEINVENWRCPECIYMKPASKTDKKKFNKKHFNELLQFLLTKIYQNKDFREFDGPLKINSVFYPMDLQKIKSLVNNFEFNNSIEFLGHIKWITHNSNVYFPENEKLIQSAKNLQTYCETQLRRMEYCEECFAIEHVMEAYRDHCVTYVCAKPHIILWVKWKSFPFWPAKLVAINGDAIDVEFFGKHDSANVNGNDCFLYSRQNPTKNIIHPHKQSLNESLMEADRYIENLTAKFGAFNYAELKTAFNPKAIDQHLSDMLPSLRNNVQAAPRAGTSMSNQKVHKKREKNIQSKQKLPALEVKEISVIEQTATNENSINVTHMDDTRLVSPREGFDKRILKQNNTRKRRSANANNSKKKVKTDNDTQIQQFNQDESHNFHEETRGIDDSVCPSEVSNMHAKPINKSNNVSSHETPELPSATNKDTVLSSVIEISSDDEDYQGNQSSQSDTKFNVSEQMMPALVSIYNLDNMMLLPQQPLPSLQPIPSTSTFKASLSSKNVDNSLIEPDLDMMIFRDEMNLLKEEVHFLKSRIQTIINDTKNSQERECQRWKEEVQKEFELDRNRLINELKQQSKSFCANCGRVARLFCCPNTIYCDCICQRMHLIQHKPKCRRSTTTMEN